MIINLLLTLNSNLTRIRSFLLTIIVTTGIFSSPLFADIVPSVSVAQPINTIKIYDVFELDSPSPEKRAAFGKLILLYKEAPGFGCNKNSYACNRVVWALLDEKGDLYELPISELTLSRNILNFQGASNLVAPKNSWALTVPTNQLENMGNSRSFTITSVEDEVTGETKLRIGSTFSDRVQLFLKRVDPGKDKAVLEKLNDHFKYKVVAPFVVSDPTENKYFALPRGPGDMGYVIYSDFSQEQFENLEDGGRLKITGVAFFRPYDADSRLEVWGLYRFEYMVNRWMLPAHEDGVLLKRYKLRPREIRGSKNIYFNEVKVESPDEFNGGPDLYFPGLDLNQLRYEPLDQNLSPQRVFPWENAVAPVRYESRSIPQIKYSEVPSDPSVPQVLSPTYNLVDPKNNVSTAIGHLLNHYGEPVMNERFWQTIIHANKKDEHNDNCTGQMTSH